MQQITVCVHTNHVINGVIHDALVNLKSVNYNFALNMLDCSRPGAPQCYDDVNIRDLILSWPNYWAYPDPGRDRITCLQKQLNLVATEYVVFVAVDYLKVANQADFTAFLNRVLQNDFTYHSMSLFGGKTRIMRRMGGVYTKYKTLEYAYVDLLERVKLNERLKVQHVANCGVVERAKPPQTAETSDDKSLYEKRSKHELFGRNIKSIDGAMGDHIASIYCLRSDDIVTCKYTALLDPIVERTILWDDELFGGGGFTFYEHGSHHNKPSLVDTWHSMFGMQHKDMDFEYPHNVERLKAEKCVAVSTSSSVNPDGTESNKNWSDIKWFKLIAWLKTVGYSVVQVGSFKDRQIPNVNAKLLDTPPQELASFLKSCEFVITVENFVHHFARACRVHTLCLTPANNEHAYYNEFVQYLTKPDETIKSYSNKWFIDQMQTERRLSMKNIEVDDVKSILLDSFVDVGINEISDDLLFEKTKCVIPQELNALCSALRLKIPQNVVEINASAGDTFVQWLQLYNIQNVVAVLNEKLENTKKAQLIDKFDERVVFHDDIHSVRREFSDKVCDLLFINCAEYKKALYDFREYATLCSNGTTVAFHNITETQYNKNSDNHCYKLWKQIKLFFEYDEFTFTEYGRKIKNEAYSKGGGGYGGIGTICFDVEKFKKFCDFIDRSNRVCIVIGCYNNWAHTQRALQSIINAKDHNTTLVSKVIVHNNGSTDETPEELAKLLPDCPWLHIITSDIPLGYARAYNYASQAADTPFIVWMNNDVQVWDNWLDLLMQPHFENTDIAFTGPMQIESGLIPGCLLCFDVEKLKRTGFLTESFEKGYYEDDEYLARVEKCGYRAEAIDKNIKDFGKGMASVNFPMSHISLVTFGALDDIERIKQKNQEKWEFNRTPTKVYRLFAETPGFVEKMVKTFVAEDPNCLVEIVTSRFDFLHYFHIMRPDIAYHMNVSMFPCYDTSALRNYENQLNVYENEDISRQITWMAKFNDYASMGILSRQILANLPKTYDVSIINIIGEYDTQDRFINFLNGRPEGNGLGIMFSYPDQYHELKKHRFGAVYTGCDTSGGIANFADNANHADVLITPSALSRSFMRNVGVTKPIFKFPHGVNTKLFKFRNKIKSNPFVFLYIGELSDRKGIFQLIEAFRKNFAGNDGVRLVLRSNNDMNFYGSKELYAAIKGMPNIEVRRQDLGQSDIATVMSEAHCYIYPSRADTFGMTPFEAMSVGLPVLMTDEGLGVCEYLDGHYIKLKSKVVPVIGHPWMQGDWQEVDVDDCATQMQWIYDNFDTYKTAEHSEFIEKNFTWEKVVRDFVPFFDAMQYNKRKENVLVLVTSYNRPEYLDETMESLQKNISFLCSNYDYTVKICDQSDRKVQHDIAWKYDNVITNEFNYGQRGAILELYSCGIFDGYDYVILTDHDNKFIKPLDVYIDLLKKDKSLNVVTGYLSPEHGVDKVMKTDSSHAWFKKSLCRAGSMCYRGDDFRRIVGSLRLDSKYGLPENSDTNIGLDWALTYWDRYSPGSEGMACFVGCIPNGMAHEGWASSWRSTNKKIIQEIELSPKTQALLSTKLMIGDMAEHKTCNYR